MNFRKRKSDDSDLLIDIAPLIDVVFILLIFFMVTTTFSRESELQIKLPEASRQEDPQEAPDTIHISIDAQGHYFVGDKALINDSVETLKAALKKELERFPDNKSPPVLLNADGAALHQATIRVMDAARQVGLVRLGFATQHTPE